MLDEGGTGIDGMPAAVAALERDAERRTTPCGSGRVVWRLWGSGPAVVLFHGAYGSWTHWLKTIPALAQSHRVIVPDIPGFGDSDAPPEPVSVDSLAAILAAGVEEIIPGQSVAFAGFSFGGQMAGGCARLLKSRTRQVILVSTSNLGVQRGAFEPNVGWRKLQTRAERDAAHRRNLEIVMFADPAGIDDQAVWIQRSNAERSQLRGRPLQPVTQLRLVLAEAGCPIALVCGAEDPRFKSSLGPIREAILAIRTDAEVIVLEGAGHWLSYEAPDRLNRALLGLLDKYESARSGEDAPTLLRSP